MTTEGTKKVSSAQDGFPTSKFDAKVSEIRVPLQCGHRNDLWEQQSLIPFYRSYR